MVIKSHRNYGFVIYKRDTLIGGHIFDNNTLKGRVWNLAHVYDDENGKQATTVGLSFRLVREINSNKSRFHILCLTLSHSTHISIMR